MRRLASILASSFAFVTISSGIAGAANLMETIAGQPGLSKFSGALRASGLDQALVSGKYTVFAPNDATIEAMPQGQWASLMEEKNKSALAALLRGHIVRGDYSSKRLVDAKQARYSVPTLAGKAIRIDKRTVLKANDVALYRLDVVADNGTLHVIDKVLQPAKAEKPSKAEKPAKAEKKKFRRVAKRG